MLHAKSCNTKHNFESVFRYFASAVNSNQSTKCTRREKIFTLSVVIETFKNSFMFPCTPFANRCLVYSDWALYDFYQLAQLIRQTRRDSHCADSPDRDSGFTRSLQCPKKEVKFIRIYSLWPRFSVRCPYYREFFQIKYMRILSGHWKLSVIERCPYQRGGRTQG